MDGRRVYPKAGILPHRIAELFGPCAQCCSLAQAADPRRRGQGHRWGNVLRRLREGAPKIVPAIAFWVVQHGDAAVPHNRTRPALISAYNAASIGTYALARGSSTYKGSLTCPGSNPERTRSCLRGLKVPVDSSAGNSR